MSISIPPELNWVVEVAAGQGWPKGNEDHLSLLGDAWNTAGEKLMALANDLGSVSSQVFESISGPAAKQFGAFMDSLHVNIPQLADGAGQLGALGKSVSLQLEYAKYMILLQLIWMAEQIAEWSATIFGSALVPEIEAAGEIAVQSILRTLIKQVARSVAESVAAQVGMDAAVQVIQFLKGDRHSWDTTSTVGAVKMGALAGALGGVLHIGAGYLAPDLMKSFVGHVGMGAINGVVIGEIANVAMGGDQNLGEAALGGAFGGAVGYRSHGGEKVDVPEIDVKAMGDIKDLGNLAGDVPNFGGTGKDSGGFGDGGTGLPGYGADKPPSYEGSTGIATADKPSQTDTGFQAKPGTTDNILTSTGTRADTSTGTSTGSRTDTRSSLSTVSSISTETSLGTDTHLSTGTGTDLGSSFHTSLSTSGGTHFETAGTEHFTGLPGFEVTSSSTAPVTSQVHEEGAPAESQSSLSHVASSPAQVRAESGLPTASEPSRPSLLSEPAHDAAVTTASTESHGELTQTAEPRSELTRTADSGSTLPQETHAQVGETVTLRPQGNGVAADESWRHSEATKADWFNPSPQPLHPDQWQQARQTSDFRRVQTEEADVHTTSHFIPAADGGRPKVVIERTDGLIRYDVRRIEAQPGQFVREFTVRLRMTGEPGVTPEQVAAIQDRAKEGVDALVNQGYRLPSGDQLHVRVEFEGDDAAATTDVPPHAVVSVSSGSVGATQDHWPAGAPAPVLAHEVLHYLGVRDEVFDPQRVFLEHPVESGLGGVHEDGGLMGGAVNGDGSTFLPRYAWKVEQVSDSQVLVPESRHGAGVKTEVEGWGGKLPDIPGRWELEHDPSIPTRPSHVPGPSGHGGDDGHSEDGHGSDSEDGQSEVGGRSDVAEASAVPLPSDTESDFGLPPVHLEADTASHPDELATDRPNEAVVQPPEEHPAPAPIEPTVETRVETPVEAPLDTPVVRRSSEPDIHEQVHEQEPQLPQQPHEDPPAAEPAKDPALETKAAEDKALEDKAAEDKAAEDKAAADRAAEDRAAEEAAKAKAVEEEAAAQAKRDREEAAAKAEAERLAREEADRKEAERKEAERQEAERKEAERREAERKEAERKEAERKEAERKEAERKEAERKEVERKEAERKEAERKEVERKEAERKEAERKEAERKEAERKEAERKEAERKEAERKEAERNEAERKEAERKEAERKEAERKEAERKEAERKEAERKEAERKEAEREERERQLEADRLERERLERERLEQERLEAERLAEEARRLAATPPPPQTLVELHDERDQNQVFAPASYTTANDGRQAIGPETIELANDRVHNAIRGWVVANFPVEHRASIGRQFDARFRNDRLEGEIQQGVGDQLEFTVNGPGGEHTVIVRLRLGDWTQVTDPRGTVLATDAQPHLGKTGREDARTRQVIDFSQTADSSRGIGGGIDSAYSPSGTHGLGDHTVNGAGGSGQVKTPLSRNTEGTGVSTSGGTTRYAKGSSYRAVDFLFDTGVEVFVRPPNRDTYTYQHSVVKDGAIVRYSRENTRTRAKGPGEDFATSNTWGGRPAESSTAALTTDHLRIDGVAHATPNQLRTELYPAFTADPARLVTMTDATKVEVPRISVPVAIDHVAEVRSMVFQTAKERLREPNTDAHNALKSLTSVQSLLGSVTDASHGELRSTTLHGTGVLNRNVADAVSMEVSFHNPVIVSDHDSFTRLDSEDVFTRIGRSPHSQSDAVDLTAAGNFALKRVIGWSPNIPVNVVRSVDQNRPGEGFGHIELHKLKFTNEPTVLVRFDTKITARSDSDRGTANETAAHTWMRVLVSDVKDKGWATFDPHADPWASLDPAITSRNPADELKLQEHALRNADGRTLRLPALFDRWLPPNSRVSEWTGDAGAVLDHAVDLVNSHFPEYIDRSTVDRVHESLETPTGWATRIIGARAAGFLNRYVFRGSDTHGEESITRKARLDAFDNYLTLADTLRPEALARRLHVMANGGLMVPLDKPGAVHGSRLVMRIEAKYNREDFQYRRTLGGQMEVYYGDFFDLGGSTKRAISGSVGGDSSFSVGQASTGKLSETDFKPGFRYNRSQGTSETSGYGAGGAVGGGSDWLADFAGRFDFHVSVHEEMPGPDHAAAPVTPRRLEEGAGGGALADGTPRTYRAQPVRVDGRLFTSEDIVEERDTSGNWHSTLDYKTVVDLDGAAPPRRDLTGAGGPRRTWTPVDEQIRNDPARRSPTHATDAEYQRMPQNALLMGDPRQARNQVVAGFRALGLDHVPAPDLQRIDQALTGAGPRLRDFMVEGGRPIWSGRIDHSGTVDPRNLGDRMFEVSIEATPGGLTAMGEPSDHAYTYLHSLGSANVGRTEEHDDGSLSYSLQLNWPVKLTETVDGKEQTGPHTINPSANISRSTADPYNETRGTGGQFDRVAINVGKQVWAEGTTGIRVRVRTWHQYPGYTTEERVHTARNDVEVPTMALMPQPQAHRLGLAPAADGPKGPHADPNTLLPPVNVLRGDGIGHAMIGDVPELTDLYRNIMTTARADLSRAEANAVEVEVAKATTLIASKATLEQSLAGYSLLVPVRDKGIINSYIKVNIKARLSNPEHVGPSDSPFVLERKNVRTVTEQEGHGASVTWGGGASLTKTYDTSGRDVVREYNTGISSGYSHQRGQNYTNTRGFEESLGMLNLPGLAEGERRAAKFVFDVSYDASIERALAPTGVFNTLTADVLGWHSRSDVRTTDTEGSLELSYPEAITQRADTGVAVPAVRPDVVVVDQRLAHGANVPDSGRGRPVTQEDLREVDVETVGNLAEVRRQAQSMFSARRLGLFGESTSWQRGLQRLQHRIETVTSGPYMDRWFLRMATGDGEALPLTVPGAIYDSKGTLQLTPKIVEWHTVDTVGDGAHQGATLSNTLIKDFQRTVDQQGSSRGVSTGVNVGVTANVKESSNVHDVPDPTAPGVLDTSTHSINVTPSGRIDTGVASGGQRVMREWGDKTTGRDYTRIAVDRVEWTLTWRPDSGSVKVRTFDVEHDAAVLWAPTRYLNRLTDHGLVHTTTPGTGDGTRATREDRPIRLVAALPDLPELPPRGSGHDDRRGPDPSADGELLRADPLMDTSKDTVKVAPKVDIKVDTKVETKIETKVEEPRRTVVQDPEPQPVVSRKPEPTVVPESSVVHTPEPQRTVVAESVPAPPPMVQRAPLRGLQEGYVAERVRHIEGQPPAPTRPTASVSAEPSTSVPSRTQHSDVAETPDEAAVRRLLALAPSAPTTVPGQEHELEEQQPVQQQPVRVQREAVVMSDDGSMMLVRPRHDSDGGADEDTGRPAPTQVPAHHTTASGGSIPTDSARSARPAPRGIDDENWRHSEQKTADWFDAEPKPLRPSDWALVRKTAPFRRVQTEEADVRTSSTIVPGKPGEHPIIKLQRTDGLIRYDMRRMAVPSDQPGQPARTVREFTVRVRLQADDKNGVTPEDVAAVRESVTTGVDEMMNKGFRLPGGDQFHVRVEFDTGDTAAKVAPPHAHVTVSPRGTDATQRRWPADARPEILAHEVLHYLGARDESFDNGRVLLNRGPGVGNGAVHDDSGMMGDAVLGEGARFLPRYAWVVKRVADSQVSLPEPRPDERPEGERTPPSLPKIPGRWDHDEHQPDNSRPMSETGPAEVPEQVQQQGQVQHQETEQETQQPDVSASVPAPVHAPAPAPVLEHQEPAAELPRPGLPNPEPPNPEPPTTETKQPEEIKAPETAPEVSKAPEHGPEVPADPEPMPDGEKAAGKRRELPEPRVATPEPAPQPAPTYTPRPARGWFRHDSEPGPSSDVGPPSHYVEPPHDVLGPPSVDSGTRKLTELYDERDETLVFAPAVYGVDGDRHQAIGAESVDMADGRLLNQARGVVLAAFDGDAREAVGRQFDARFRLDAIKGELQQAVGDQIEFVVRVGKQEHTVVLRLRLGNWTQATDPHGYRLITHAEGDLGNTQVIDARTRQVIDDSHTSANGRGPGGGIDLSAAPSGTQGRGDHNLDGFGGAGQVKTPLRRDGRGNNVSTSGGTTRYAKGSSYRAVDFLFDTGIEAFVRGPNGNLTYEHGVAVNSLIVRYSRENAQHRDTEADRYSASAVQLGKQFATSDTWADTPGPNRTEQLETRYNGLAANTNDARVAREQELLPPRGSSGVTVDESGGEVAIPRISVPVAINGAGHVRAAIFRTAKRGDTQPGSDSRIALNGFSKVQSLLGGLMEASSGKLVSSTLHEKSPLGLDIVDAVGLTARFYNPVIVGDHDPFTRLDSEDVFSRSGSAPVTQTDSLDLLGAFNLLLSKSFGVGPVIEAAKLAFGWSSNSPLNVVRSVEQRRPGDGFGHIELHKLKFTDEPTVLVRFDTRITTTSEANPRAGEPVDVHTWARVLVSDVEAAGWHELPANQARADSVLRPTIAPQHEGDLTPIHDRAARNADRRDLRLPDLFGGWLPPNSRISGWEGGDEGARRVLNHAIDVVNREFPQYFGHTTLERLQTWKGSGVEQATAFRDWFTKQARQFLELAPAVPAAPTAAVHQPEPGTVPAENTISIAERLHGFDNFLTLVHALRPENLARNIHVMANGGLLIPLVKPGTMHGEQIVLRVDAEYDHTQFEYQRTLGGQMEVYYGDFFDLSGSTRRAFSATAGGDSSWSLGKSTWPWLKEVDFKLGFRYSVGKGTTEGSGYNAGGAIGGGSNWLAEFGGDFRFRISEHTDVAAPAARIEPAETQSSADPPTPADPTAPAPAVPTDRTTPASIDPAAAVRPDPTTTVHTYPPRAARPGPTLTDEWITVRGRLLTSEDIVGELDRTEGEYRSTLDFETVPPQSQYEDAFRRVSPTLDPTAPNHWDLSGPGLPQNALLMGNTRELREQAVHGLSALGVSHLPAEQLMRIDAALAGAGPRLRDFMTTDGNTIWTGRIDHSWTVDPRNLADRMFQIDLRVEPGPLTAFGPPSDHAYTYQHSLAGATVTRGHDWNDGSLTLSAQVNFPVSLKHELVDGKETQGPHALNPSLGVSAGPGKQSSSSHSVGGQFDRVAINVGQQVWSHGDATATLTVKGWHVAPVLHVKVFEGERQMRGVSVRTLALMPRYEASLLRLTRIIDPDPAGHAPRGTLTPPRSVLRGDGIGHAMIGDVPNLDLLRSSILREATPMLTHAEKEALAVELRKATTLVASKAMLEQSLAGYSLLVPLHEHGVVNSYVKLTLKARLSDAVHEGPADAPYVLERKNVRTVTDQRGHGSSFSAGVNVSATNTYDTGGRDVLREHNKGVTVAYSHSHGLNISESHGTEDSLGMLNLPGLAENEFGEKEPRAAQFSFRVHYDYSIERHTAPSAFINTPTYDFFGRNVELHHTIRLDERLHLSYPEALTRRRGSAIDPAPRGEVVGTPLVHRNAAAPDHPTGSVRLTPDLLREVDVEFVGNLPEIRRQAQELFSAQRLGLYGEAGSWQRSVERVHHVIETVTSSAYLVRSLPYMLTRHAEGVELTKPGGLIDGHGTLELLPSIIRWRTDKEPSPDPNLIPPGDLTVGNTLIKRFQRTIDEQASSHSASNGMSLTVTGNIKESDNIKSVPDPSARGALNTETTGISLTPSARVDTSRGNGGQRVMREWGDKTTGRDFTRVIADEVEWTLLWRPEGGGTARGVTFRIRDEAAVFWVPTDRLPALPKLNEAPPAPPVAPAPVAPPLRDRETASIAPDETDDHRGPSPDPAGEFERTDRTPLPVQEPVAMPEAAPERSGVQQPEVTTLAERPADPEAVTTRQEEAPLPVREPSIVEPPVVQRSGDEPPIVEPTSVEPMAEVPTETRTLITAPASSTAAETAREPVPGTTRDPVPDTTPHPDPAPPTQDPRTTASASQLQRLENLPSPPQEDRSALLEALKVPTTDPESAPPQPAPRIAMLADGTPMPSSSSSTSTWSRPGPSSSTPRPVTATPIVEEPTHVEEPPPVVGPLHVTATDPVEESRHVEESSTVESPAPAPPVPAPHEAAPAPAPAPSPTATPHPQEGPWHVVANATVRGNQPIGFRPDGAGNIELSTGQVLPQRGWTRVDGGFVNDAVNVSIGIDGQVRPAGEDGPAATADQPATPGGTYNLSLDPTFQTLNFIGQGDASSPAQIQLSAQGQFPEPPGNDQQ